MKKLTVVLSVAALAAFGLAACGGDDDEESAGAEATPAENGESGGGGGGASESSVSVSADPDGALAYTETSLSAPAGAVTIEFENPASIGHDVVVEDPDGNELARTEVIADDTATTSAELEPGEYTYYCSVANHRESGMEGTLAVE